MEPYVTNPVPVRPLWSRHFVQQNIKSVSSFQTFTSG